MSNFYPTIGRNVQFIDEQGNAVAAIIIEVYANGEVDLVAFSRAGSTYPIESVRPHVVGARNSENLRTYKLNWPCR